MKTKRACLREYQRVVGSIRMPQNCRAQIVENCVSELSKNTPSGILKPGLAAFAALAVAAAVSVPQILRMLGK